MLLVLSIVAVAIIAGSQRRLPPPFGPAANGNPGQRIRTTVEYPGEGAGTFEAEGYLAVDERERRMEWGLGLRETR